MDGTVECDAAIMDGFSGAFGSVGAVSGNFWFYTVLILIDSNGRSEEAYNTCSRNLGE